MVIMEGNDLLADLDAFLAEHEAELIDRKSTRLNSSHSQISYAVFCLKKKKTTHLPDRAVWRIYLDLLDRAFQASSIVVHRHRVSHRKRLLYLVALRRPGMEGDKAIDA